MRLLLNQGFWAISVLPLIPLCAASQRSFSVHNDLFAFPQYDISFSESFIYPEEAARRLSRTHSSKDTGADEDAVANAHPSLHDFAHNVKTKATGLDGERYERMKFQDRSYLCTIPFVTSVTAEDNTTSTSKEEQAQELVRATDRGWELLSDMKGSCIYYGVGWWVYSFCYDDGIKQFHPVPRGTPGVPVFPPAEDPNAQSYVLGRFEGSKGVNSQRSLEAGAVGSEEGTVSLSPSQSHLQTKGETNFLVQTLGGGTMCDLTGKERRVEVQFHCNPAVNDQINLIKETASCVYLMVIHTPKLCNDVAFLPPQVERPHTILCEEIVAHDDLPTWKQRKTEESEREIFIQTTGVADDLKRQMIIGGIVVGGQKLVGGSPERSIRVPQEIGSNPQKETRIATLASYDGKYTKVLSDAEIKNLGLKASKADIDHSIHKMEELAKGSPWRLDVIKTHNGLKLEGMTIEDDEADNDGNEEDNATTAAKQDTRERKKRPRSKSKDRAGKKGSLQTKRPSDKDEDDQSYEENEEGGSEEEYK